MSDKKAFEISKAADSVVVDFKRLLHTMEKSLADVEVFGLRERDPGDGVSTKRIQNKRSRDLGHFLEQLSIFAGQFESHDSSLEFLKDQLGSHSLFQIQPLNSENDIHEYATSEFTNGAFNVEFFDCRMDLWLLVSQFS